MGSSFDTFDVADNLGAIERSSAATYQPDQIVLRAWQQTGNGTVQTHAGRFIIAECTDGSGTTFTDRYTSTSDELSKNYTPSTGVTHLRIRLYVGGTTPAASGLCDEEIIPIVSGSTTVTSALTNDFHVVPTSVSGNSPNWAIGNSSSDMKVYVGAVDDTANWTYAVTSTTGGANGSFGTGLFVNRFTLSALTSDTGTVTLRATKGATTTTKVITVVKQYSLADIRNPANRARWITVTNQLAADPFRMYFAPANPANPDIINNPSNFAVTPAHLVNTAGASPWFDGVTVYIHSVDAELRSDGADADTHPDRIDSGVRLWNGRGSLISLRASTYPGRTGISFATNDSAYIVGHYNADGSINSSSSSTTVPGGYSARYPESANEMLSAVMADAITILSQPSFESSGGVYSQTGGWSDSLSAHRKDTASAYTTSWATTNPNSSTNRRDGVNTSMAPANMPNLGNLISGPGTAVTAKLGPVDTEISTALLMGIVPTNHNASGLTDASPSPAANNQSSGGVHNFPRLAEHWNGTALYIRGSMVAMFESRVAMEPWTLRAYTAAERMWGLHENFRSVNHDLPLEPVLLNARRVRFREMTAGEYGSQKTIIEALPH